MERRRGRRASSAGTCRRRLAEQRGDPSSFSRRRDRAGRVDEGAARRQRASRARAGPSSWSAASRSIVCGDLRQRASGREASVPRSEQGGSEEDSIEVRAEIRLGRVGTSNTVTLRSAEAARQSAAISAARRGSGSTETISPLSPMRAAIVAGLDPRAGAEVEHALARLRVEQRDHGLRAARSAAPARRSAIRRRPARRSRPVDDDRLGAARATSAPPRPRRPRPRPRAARRPPRPARRAGVLTRSAVSAGSFRPPAAARRLGARAGPTTSAPARADPSGRPRPPPASSRRQRGAAAPRARRRRGAGPR